MNPLRPPSQGTAAVSETKPTKHLILKLHGAQALSSHEFNAVLIEKLNALLERIKNSHLYTPEELEALESWELTFFTEFLQQINTLTTSDSRDRASKLLCYLLESIIFEPFDRLNDYPNLQDQILLLEDALLEILSLTLPEGESVEIFHTKYRQLDSAEKTLSQLIEVIDVYVNNLIAALYTFANEISADSREKYEALRLRLKTACLQKQEIGNEVFDTLENLVQKIKTTCSNTLSQEAEFKVLFDRFERHEAVLDQTLARSEKILSGR